MTLVLDASVALKWFVEEPSSADARRLLEGGRDLAAPDLLAVEVGNALWRLTRRNEIGTAQALLAIDALGRAVPTVLPSWELRTRALEIAATLGHPVYDCVYLAAAERLGAPLVTADERLVARVGGTAWGDLAVGLAAAVRS